MVRNLPVHSKANNLYSVNLVTSITSLTVLSPTQSISAGLMISGFAHAHQVLGDPAYLERATAAAQFVRTHLYNPEKGVLIRNAYRDNNGSG